MEALVSEIATRPELASVYRERAVEPRRATLAPVIERGIARGDLRPDTDVQVVHEFLVGPIFYRLLFSGGKLDRKLGTRIVDGSSRALRRATVTWLASASSRQAAIPS
jgi:Tetracyclin repressor-like, C-terminal domain